MEIQEMPKAVLLLILIGIILGIGMTILGTLASDIRDEATKTDDRFNATNTSCVELTFDHITTSSVSFENNTGAAGNLPSGCFAFDKTGTYKGSCVTLHEEVSGCSSLEYKFVNASYTYGAANTQSDAVDDTSDGIAGFVTWLSILVVVISAAIIVGLVIRSFKA